MNKFIKKLKLRKRKVLITIMAVLFLLTFFVSLLTLSFRPSNRLLSFNVRYGTLERAVSTTQTFVLDFSRPINAIHKKDLANYIVFYPSVPANYQLNGEKIIITTTSLLTQGESYSVSVRKGLTDIYGFNLASGYELKFKTVKPEYLFTKFDEGTAKLFWATVGENNGIIVPESDYIREYVSYLANSEIIFTTQEEENSPTKLNIYNTQTAQLNRIDLKENLLLSSLQVNRFGDIFFLGQEPFSGDENGNSDATRLPAIYRYDRNKRNLRAVPFLDKFQDSLFNFRLTPDGNSLILQQYNYTWSIISLLDGQTSILPSLQDLSNITTDGNTYAATIVDPNTETFSPRVQVVQKDKPIFVSDTSGYRIEPTLSRDGKIFATSIKTKDLPAAEGQFSVEIYRLNTSKTEDAAMYEKTQLLGSTNYSIELPQLSSTGQYLAVEVVDLADLDVSDNAVRRYLNPGKVASATTVIYTAGSRGGYEQMVVIDGATNLMWLE